MTDRTSLTNEDLLQWLQEIIDGHSAPHDKGVTRLATECKAEITQLRGNLSLAEDGLAAAMQEIGQRDQQLKQSVDHEVEYKREIEQLRDALRRARRIAAEGTTHIGMIAALGILVDRALNHSGPLPPFDSPSNEPLAVAPFPYPTDRDGWICSVCHGWNVPKDRVCMHSHLPPELKSAEGQYCVVHNTMECPFCQPPPSRTGGEQL